MLNYRWVEWGSEELPKPKKLSLCSERTRVREAINEGLYDIEQGRFVDDVDLDKEFGSVESIH